jgi:hypothetical protein
MNQVQAQVAVIKAVAEAIQSLGEVPAGHLYANLMGHGLSLDTFESIIGILVAAEVVKRDGSHLLTWIGPSVTKGNTEPSGAVSV